MSTRFFTPFIGRKYNEGIKGKKILVLGASFYCPNTDCKYFKQCTDVDLKDSSRCDTICPIYCVDNKVLHDEPTYCIDDAPKTYQTFASYLSSIIGIEDYSTIWSHLAFTNYVQFFLPASSKGFRETRWTDLSERDFEAFIQTVKEISPDIIIVWGCVINNRLKENNEYVTDGADLPSTEGYLCHMQIPGMQKQIALINPYHPSSSAWHSALPILDKYLKQALNEK